MDENSDVDNSLSDLHHGLDSSFEEHTSGLSRQELARSCASVSMDTSNSVGVGEDQVSMLQDMVLEMKEGFKTALKELAKIQDKEEGETYHSKKLQQEQQRQLDNLTETIHEIKDQLCSLTKSVKQIKDEQKNIKDHLEEVTSNRGSSQESKTRNDRMGLLNDFSHEEWNTKLPELPTEFNDQNTSSRLTFETDDNQLMVTACKSLTLTQAMIDKCLKLNLSQSSDEEDEEYENLRVSYYKPKTTTYVSSRIENRRHSMPTSAASQGRAKDVGIAAHRHKTVKELADLERSYCSQLWCLLHTYLSPLQTAGFLSARELGTLFPPYLDQLYAEHCQVCTGLQDRLLHWTYMGNVADLLARITGSHNSQGSVLSLYKEYVDDLLSAVTCLRRVQAQSSKFRSFLKAVKRNSCRSEDLMYLLLAPVQHIPKYLLQLQQVFRHTPPTHPDFQLLHTSLCQLQSFVDQMNEELSSTADFLNQERHTWSGGSSGQMLSTRDSGVHSNSTEEDNVLPTKSFFKARRSYLPSEWLEDQDSSIHHHKSDDIIRQRHVRSSAGRFSALSQPDLTIYNNLNSHSSDPHILPHMPRSQSFIPTGGVDSGDEVARGRQYRKFKIKQRNQSPVDFTTTRKGHIHRSLSPQVRPSSAIDFLSHSQHHQQQTSYRDNPIQLRKLHYADRHPRPHSVLGSYATDLSHKPTIISRKHMRRSQPPIPSATNFWAETSTSSTLPFQIGHQRVPLSACDLQLPKRPLHYITADVLDRDEEQDEDDTRASDTHSLGTNGSHPYSSGQGSNISHDHERDSYHGHFGGYNSQTLKMPYNPSHSSQFSSAEVLASLAKKLYDTPQEAEITHDGLILKKLSNEGMKKLPVFVKKSSTSLNNQVNGIEAKEQHNLIPHNDLDNNMLVSPIKPEQDEDDEEYLQHNTVLNAHLCPNEGYVSSFCQKRDGNLMTRNNGTKLVSSFNKNVDSVDGGSEEVNNEIKQISESNRQFILPVSSRVPGIDRVDQDSNLSMNSNKDIHNGSWASPLSKKNWSRFNSDTSDSSFPNSRTDLGKSKVHLMSRNSSIGSFHTNDSLNLSGSHGENMPSGPLSNGHPQTSHLVESKNGDRMSSDVFSLTSQQNKSGRSCISSSSNVPYYSSLPTSSHDMSTISRVTSSMDNHQSHGRKSLQLLNSTSKDTSETVKPSGAAGDISQTNGVPGPVDTCKELLSYPDIHELPQLDVDEPAPCGDKGVKKADFRKKIKEMGKFNSSDGLPKAIDDPVNARKKMHFKSSIKNLFSKKKGQVILADVEKEVVKQMITAAAEGTSKNKDYPKKTKAGNPSDCHTVMTSILQMATKQPTLETKTWKGKCASNVASMGKIPKKIYLDTTQSKFLNGENPRGPHLSACEQLHHQDILQCLRAHNKRHGIVVDSNDTQFFNTLDIGADYATTAKQDSAGKSYLHDEYCSQSRNSLIMLPSPHRPHSGSECGTECGGINICNKSVISFNQKNNPVQYQSHTVQKELTGMRNSHLNEANHLKSAPDVGKNKVLHKNSKHASEHANISKNRVDTEKYYSEVHGEFPSKRSFFNSHDLCQHCQKCETKQKEKVAPDCEDAVYDHKPDLSILKNSGPERDKNVIAFDGTHINCASQVSPSENTGHILSFVPLNDLNEGKKPLDKIRQYPMTGKSGSLNYLESCKSQTESKLVSEGDKIGHINSSHSSIEWLPEQKCKHCTSSPVQKQKLSSECQQCQSSASIHNMPDVTKTSKGATCSDKIERQYYLTDMLQQKSCLGDAVDLVSPGDTCLGDNKMFSPESFTEVCNSLERNNSSVISTALSENCYIKTPIFAPQGNMPLLSKKLVASSSLSHHFNSSCPVVSSATKSHLKEEQRSDQSLKSMRTALPKTYSNKECSQSFVMEETHNGIIVKRFSLEGKELFEHRYYDDDKMSCKNVKRSENPKSLKALSASSVIAENFKQLPRDTTLSYKNYTTSDQPLLYIPASLSSSDNVPERKQEITNLIASGNSESKVVGISGPKFSIQSTTSPDINPGNAVQTESNSQTASQILNYSSSLTETSHNTPTADSNNTEISQTDNSQTSQAAETKTLHEKSSEYTYSLFPENAGSKENSTRVNLFQSNTDLKQDRNTLSSDVSKCCARLHNTPSVSAAAPFSDESSSYKPKNPAPVTTIQLSDAPECQSSRHVRCETSSSEHLPLDGSSKHHSPSSEQATNSNSLNIPQCTISASYSFEHNIQRTNNIGLRTKNGTQFTELYPRQQPGNETLCNGRQHFLRANSPSDFFSIRPYVDYTASKASSDSGILVHSDHVQSSTPKDTKSSKGSSSEKLEKGKRHTGSRKVKSSLEKDSKCFKSPNICAENVNSSDELCQSYYSRRSRHSDGAKLSGQDEKYYHVQYPRYSADSSSLISNAFLQKMAHLSKHNVRSVSHPHVDGHLSSSTKHSSIHENLSRKAQGLNGTESSLLPSTNSNRGFRITSSTAKSLPQVQTPGSPASNDETHLVNLENHKGKSNSVKADTIQATSIQASPDLLLLNDGLREEAAIKEKSPLSKKAQSFFSMLTHSPISLFHRDSKSPNPPK